MKQTWETSGQNHDPLGAKTATSSSDRNFHTCWEEMDWFKQWERVARHEI
jgi:hypothetical protein